MNFKPYVFGIVMVLVSLTALTVGFRLSPQNTFPLLMFLGAIYGACLVAGCVSLVTHWREEREKSK